MQVIQKKANSSQKCNKMSIGKITEDQIISWIEFALRNEGNLSNYEIVLLGRSNVGDGNFGDIVCATVNGITKGNERKTLELFIKHGKNNPILRKVTRIRCAFETEIHFYDTILPTFKKFQIARNVSKRFESVPKCYGTLLRQDMEVLVLENLRTQGYELRDRTKPMNFNHLAYILKEYGKYHALSFALRDQNREEFNSIVSNYGNPYEEFLMDRDKKDAFDKNNDEALHLLREHGDEDLLKKLESVLVKDAYHLILDLEADKEPQSVILHGDNWGNNFMFRYEDDDRTSPAHVRFLDWQMSTLRTPVFDLSYFLYANSALQELDRIEELLDIYYSSFSDFLKKLGSDPEKLFTYGDLKRHWRKYSVFCILFAPTLFKIVYCQTAPTVENMKEGEDMGSFMAPEISDADAYYKRLKDVYSNYFEHVVNK